MEGVKGEPIPDCTYAVYADPGCLEPSCYNNRTCGIRKAVDAYISCKSNSGASNCGGSYGPIEDWDTSLVTDMSRVFSGKSTFNANISVWQVRKVTTMLRSTYMYTPPPFLSPQDQVFFWLFLFPFFFFCASTNSIFEQCSLLFLFPTHFYLSTFRCCCGAVFYDAGDFNGDLSTWQVGKVTTMRESTYTLSPPSPRSGLF